MRRPLACSVSFVAVLALTLAACGDGKKAPLPAPGATPAKASDPPAAGAATSASADDELIAKYAKDLDLPVVKYDWDRNAGDKAVSAELGGPGFTGEGWTTRLEFPTTNWPKAPKGGSIRLTMYDWPATLRVVGENNNSTFNSMVETLCHERLLAFDPIVMDYLPSLATHWKISADRQTYSYRINPSARWSDGSEVTADDVVATWKLYMDPKIRFPSSQVVWGKFDTPVAKSKYIVEVHCKEDNWRNFLYFSADLNVMPAKHISIPGDEYLDKFQNSYPPVSGPYTVLAEDIKMGQSVALTRRKDYWDRDNPANAGAANIDKIVFEVVKDPGLQYEKVKKGEVDFWVVPKAQWWKQEIPELESVKRGLLVMKKLYNDCPAGTGGLAINMKRAPLDDIRIRKALQMLMNRPQYIEKLYFNEYLPLASFHQSSVYQNPDNKEVPYDPIAADELLDQSGWTERNSELYRTKGGKVLQFEIIFDSQLSLRYLNLYQQDCKKAGIKLELKQLDNAAHFKLVQEKEFDLADMSWTGLFFPNPETSFKGELADTPDNNNITGFKNARVDALLPEYDRAYDMKRRVEILREIDGIVYATQPYVQGWYNPAQRFVFRNKLRMPPWGAGRTTRVDQVWFTMWVDPDAEKALDAAVADGKSTLPVEEEKNRFWQAWNAAQRRKEHGDGK